MFPEQNLKCLIHTISTKSFINTNVAKKYFPNSILYDPFKISTAHGTSNQMYSTEIPTSKIFNQVKKANLKFHLFDFHRHFDCLIGIDNLKKLNTVIDLNNNLLVTPAAKIKMFFHNGKISTKNLISVAPRSEQVIKIKHLFKMAKL